MHAFYTLCTKVVHVPVLRIFVQIRGTPPPPQFGTNVVHTGGGGGGDGCTLNFTIYAGHNPAWLDLISDWLLDTYTINQ